MKILVSIAIVALLAAPAFAYDIADLRTDAAARAQKMLKDVGDLSIEQEATFDVRGAGAGGMKSKTFMRGDKWRMEGKMSTGKSGESIETVTLFDGADLWTVAMGMKSKLPAGTMGQGMAPTFWSEPAEGAKLIGEETVHGRTCWKVQSTEAEGRAPTVTWFDKASFVPVQTESKLSGKTLRTVFSDFREVKGYPLPHLTETFSDGKKSMTAKILKVEANAKLADDLFDPEKLAGEGGMDMDAVMKQAEAMKKKMLEQQGGKGGK
jgi:outer membrane lipoprotein-sorting protein